MAANFVATKLASVYNICIMTRKIGVISDVHGNIEALNAILQLLDEEKCDEIIHTGDVVSIGPNSRECLELLLGRNDVTLLLGNHDRDFALNHTAVRNLSHVPAEHKEQVFATLTERERQAVKNFPLFVVRNCGKSKIVFTHYAFKPQPTRPDEFPFMPLQTEPTAEKFDEIFASLDGTGCDAVFFGHKHEPCDLVGKRLYVDVGSVGCHPDPLARGIVIEYDENAWSYRRVYAPYDMESTHKTMLQHLTAGEHLYDFYFLRKHPNK